MEQKLEKEYQDRRKNVDKKEKSHKKRERSKGPWSRRLCWRGSSLAESSRPLFWSPGMGLTVS